MAESLAASVSLPTFVNGVAEVCGKSAQALQTLQDSIMSSREGLSSLSAECLITKNVLERLEVFLKPESAHHYSIPKHQFLDYTDCFEVLVQAINSVILDVDLEITRLRRYSRDRHPLSPVKTVPTSQDLFVDIRHHLRKNRSSLTLMLECIISGILADAKIHFPHNIHGKHSEKGVDPQRLQHEVVISLSRQIATQQQLVSRFRPKNSRSYKTDSRVIRKLHDGITNGEYDVVYKCLSDKVDPNAPAKGTRITPIHRAISQTEAALASDDEVAAKDLVSIVTALILAGANLHVVDDDQRTPLIRAVKGEMGDLLVSLMLEFGARADAMDSEKNTALHYAAMQRPSAEMKNINVIKILLANGSDKGIRNIRGQTPLYIAVMWQQLDRATELLDYGADLEMADKHGWTPLYNAVQHGNTPLTKLLCARGAVLNKKDKLGQTALHYSLSQACQEVVEVLVAAGADVNLVSKGETPLCHATAKSNADLIALLLKHGADVSVPSPGYSGALPIHLAAIGKEMEVLRLLVDAGSPMNMADDEGRTPLLWATEVNKTVFMEFLSSRRASLDANA